MSNTFLSPSFCSRSRQSHWRSNCTRICRFPPVRIFLPSQHFWLRRTRQLHSLNILALGPPPCEIVWPLLNQPLSHRVVSWWRNWITSRSVKHKLAMKYRVKAAVQTLLQQSKKLDSNFQAFIAGLQSDRQGRLLGAPVKSSVGMGLFSFKYRWPFDGDFF